MLDISRVNIKRVNHKTHLFIISHLNQASKLIITFTAMTIRSLNSLLRISALLLILLPAIPRAGACTTAIASRSATADGSVMLWKHRDSGHPDNIVARIPASEGTLAYVGVFNASDRDLQEAWIGVNEAGFAVMNAASYNLAPDTAAIKDCEGLIMSMALARCRKAADFTAMLDSLIATGAPLGVQANFGVVDNSGAGMYVEASDHTYTVFPLADEEKGWMVRTNYSYTGDDDTRRGQMRHDAATHLIAEATSRNALTHSLLTDTLSRSFYHPTLKRELPNPGERYIPDTGDLIVRRSSCSSTVIVLPADGGTPQMWIAIGNPLLSETRKVTLDAIPRELLPSGPAHRSTLCDEANARAAKVWNSRDSRGTWLIDTDAYRRLSARADITRRSRSAHAQSRQQKR